MFAQVNGYTNNCKAMNSILFALNKAKYNKIYSCITTKKIWDKLEFTHEGTSQAKDTKISMSMH